MTKSACRRELTHVRPGVVSADHSAHGHPGKVVEQRKHGICHIPTNLQWTPTVAVVNAVRFTHSLQRVLEYMLEVIPLCVPHPILCVPHPILCVPHPNLCVPHPILCVPHPNLCATHPILCVPHPTFCVPYPIL